MRLCLTICISLLIIGISAFSVYNISTEICSMTKSINNLTNSVEIQRVELESTTNKVNDIEKEVSEMTTKLDTINKLKSESQESFIRMKSGLPDDAVKEIIKQSTNKTIDDTLLLAVAKVESGYNPKAYNKSSGATGLTQFLPSSAKYIADKHGYEYSNDLLYDPAYSIKLAATYLNDLSNDHGIYRALSYYGGEVDSTHYADKVWSLSQKYKLEKENYTKKYIESNL